MRRISLATIELVIPWDPSVGLIFDIEGVTIILELKPSTLTYLVCLPVLQTLLMPIKEMEQFHSDVLISYHRQYPPLMNVSKLEKIDGDRYEKTYILTLGFFSGYF